MKKVFCHICEVELYKDHIALNKKLLGRSISNYFCLECLADHVCCTVEDLIVKIEEFKEQGCGLFR